MGYGKRRIQRNAAAHLQKLDAIATRHRNCFGDERTNRSVGANRPAVIDEGHRDQIMSEHYTANSNQWQDTYEFACGISGSKIDTLMPEYPLDNGAPAQSMEMRVAFLRRRELVPLRLRAGSFIPLFLRTESLDSHRHAAPAGNKVAFCPSRFGRNAAMDPKLNSSSNRSRRSSAPDKPR